MCNSGYFTAARYYGSGPNRRVQETKVTQVQNYVYNISHFCRPNDRAKVKQAIAQKSVDPADIPETARPRPAVPTPVPTPNTTVSKRKSEAIAGPSVQNSRPSLPKTGNSALNATRETVEINNEEAGSQEEAADELYCVMQTQVVGLQYYNGKYASI